MLMLDMDSRMLFTVIMLWMDSCLAVGEGKHSEDNTTTSEEYSRLVKVPDSWTKLFEFKAFENFAMDYENKPINLDNTPKPRNINVRRVVEEILKLPRLFQV